jgi:hypothetical protein
MISGPARHAVLALGLATTIGLLPLALSQSATRNARHADCRNCIAMLSLPERPQDMRV